MLTECQENQIPSFISATKRPRRNVMTLRIAPKTLPLAGILHKGFIPNMVFG